MAKHWPQALKKWIEVVAEDRSQPAVEDWKLLAPRQGTRRALQLHFPEPLDHALLFSRLWIINEQEEPVEGRIEVLNEERHWQFIPDKSWAAGTYLLRVSTKIEDLAGNNLRRLFDTDVEEEKKLYLKNGSLLTCHL